MVILITGASHTGKTVLAQKLLEKYNFTHILERYDSIFERYLRNDSNYIKEYQTKNKQLNDLILLILKSLPFDLIKHVLNEHIGSIEILL